MSRLCQEPGCTSEAIACYLPDLDRGQARQQTAYAYLCSAHAYKRGHCKGCGEFWGGVESFEFMQGGLCDNCFAQDEAERRDEWDDDPFDDDPDDGP